MEELVSIVVPVYNVEAYLDECIQSLVDQTYQNLEIILVDDGSTDHSSEQCKQWEQRDHRISVIRKKNAGLGMARNTGMDHARGKYIFFIDSDDYVDVSLVQKCMQSAAEACSQVVIYGRKNVSEDRTITLQKIKTPTLRFCDDQIVNELLPGILTYDYGFGVSAWGKMYSLDILKENNLRFVSEREIISEDVIFALELFPVLTSVSIIPEGLYYYRKRGESLTSKYRKDRQKQNEIFLRKSMEYVEKKSLPDNVKTHLLVRYYSYSLAHMKQIVAAGIPRKEKYTELYQVFHDQTLRDSLTDTSLAFCSSPARLFWKNFQRKHYWLCILFLWYKTRR